MLSTFIAHITKNSTAIKMCICLTCALMLCLVCSCTSPEEELQAQKKKSHIQVDGFNVPKMESAAHQLSLAKVSDDVSAHRVALFKAVPLLFPHNRELIGLAELELTYLGLGPDYRKSSRKQLQKAADKYLQLSTTYRAYPQIAAKALWYNAWLNVDMLDEKNGGTVGYMSIVERYPNQHISQAPSIPWTSINIVGPQKESEKRATPPTLTWAELAYLELIRNTQSDKQSLIYYNSLIKRYPQSSLKPKALMLITQRGSE